MQKYADFYIAEVKEKERAPPRCRGLREQGAQRDLRGAIACSPAPCLGAEPDTEGPQRAADVAPELLGHPPVGKAPPAARRAHGATQTL